MAHRKIPSVLTTVRNGAAHAATAGSESTQWLTPRHRRSKEQARRLQMQRVYATASVTRRSVILSPIVQTGRKPNGKGIRGSKVNAAPRPEHETAIEDDEPI
jgi:hypothetical protein